MPPAPCCFHGRMSGVYVFCIILYVCRLYLFDFAFVLYLGAPPGLRRFCFCFCVCVCVCASVSLAASGGRVARPIFENLVFVSQFSQSLAWGVAV